MTNQPLSPLHPHATAAVVEVHICHADARKREKLARWLVRNLTDEQMRAVYLLLKETGL